MAGTDFVASHPAKPGAAASQSWFGRSGSSLPIISQHRSARMRRRKRSMNVCHGGVSYTPAWSAVSSST